MNRYILAIAREQRANVQSDWKSALASIEGLAIEGDASPHRAEVSATDEAIQKVRAQFGERILIEPLIKHTTL